MPVLLGATGHFPDGKLHEHDEGELQMLIAERGEVIEMRFGKPIEWLGLRREDAAVIGRRLLAFAEGRTGLEAWVKPV